MPHCKKCQSQYPQARADLGYSICLDCSTEEKWSAVPVTYHKTGNTIEVVKDPDDAATITAMMSRKGFGVMNGLKGVGVRKVGSKSAPIERITSSEPLNPATGAGRVVARRKMPLDYEGVGRSTMEALETSGVDAALAVVAAAEQAWKILPRQAVQLRYIIETLGS